MVQYFQCKFHLSDSNLYNQVNTWLHLVYSVYVNYLLFMNIQEDKTDEMRLNIEKMYEIDGIEGVHIDDDLEIDDSEEIFQSVIVDSLFDAMRREDVSIIGDNGTDQLIKGGKGTDQSVRAEKVKRKLADQPVKGKKGTDPPDPSTAGIKFIITILGSNLVD